MTISIRPYRESEFERACAIRSITSESSIERFRVAVARSGEWVDHYLHLAIESDGELIGDVQLRHCPLTMPPGVIHFGIDIAETARGNGFGTEAVKASAKWAFAKGYHRIEGSTDSENLAMRRAFEKAGWGFEGIQKSLFVEEGVAHDYYSFAATHVAQAPVEPAEKKDGVDSIQQSVLKSERLILTALQPEDEDDLFEYQSDAETVRYIPWPMRTRTQVREAISASLHTRTFTRNDDYLLFAWRLKENGKVIGQSNISIKSKSDATAEIGWVINPSFAGRGYATEATEALITFAFEELKFHRITAYIDQRNSASVRVAERLGMRREAAYTKDEFFKGEWTSAYLYALLEEEWRERDQK